MLIRDKHLNREVIMAVIFRCSWLLKLHPFFLLYTLSIPFITLNAFAHSSLEDEKVRLSGFGIIGLTQSSDENLEYRRDLSRDGLEENEWSFKADTLFGFQVDAQLNKSFDAAFQLVARDRHENTLKDSLEWAYLRYHLSPSTDTRVGRMGVDLFMLSEYRNVGFAYLWVRPPVEFYGPLAFDHFDGADINHTTQTEMGTLHSKFFIGKTTNTFTSEVGDTEVDLSPIFGGSLSLESEQWRLRFGLASLEFDSSIDLAQQLQGALSTAAGFGWLDAIELAENLEAKGNRLRYYSLGVAYNNRPWQIQSELGFIDSNYDVFLPLLSSYISVGYQMDSVTLYGITALAKNTEDRVEIPSAPPVPALTQIQQQTQAFYNLSHINQRSMSLGLRWDLRHDLAFKIQWDHHWIQSNGGGLWIQGIPLTEERTLDTYSVNLNFLF